MGKRPNLAIKAGMSLKICDPFPGRTERMVIQDTYFVRNHNRWIIEAKSVDSSCKKNNSG
jgi:hypothetical protein